MTTSVADPTIEVTNPRTGAVDYTITPPDRQELVRLVERLRAGQKTWKSKPIEERTAVLLRWAEVIERRADEIAAAESTDTGRRRLSYEVPHMVAGSIRTWCRKAADVIAGAHLSGSSSFDENLTFRTSLEPLGVVGVISPWNHPFLLSTLDAIPALLAGCAVLIKPSEVTPRFVDPVQQSIDEVPELAEVMTYVRGDGRTGQGMLDFVDAVCFTGSVGTGRKVALACADRLIPAFLELGGKDPAIITESADIDSATDAVLKGATHNNGQLCFSIERVYVARNIYDDFLTGLTKKAQEVKHNYPDIAAGQLGPFISAGQADLIADQLADAVSRGATVVTGGTPMTLGGGRYMAPTILTDVTHDMRIMREETFGPVIPVMPFDTLDEAIQNANASDYGLSACVISGDTGEAHAIAERLNAGAISIQDSALTPFIMADAEKSGFASSGLGGSRMGPNALLRFYRKRALISSTGPVRSIFELGEDQSAR